ncbi:Conserved hypothetical protein [Clostridium neonatale]|uniref:Uncharacterized protein n=1 Tax=Clostridium neonatale TaxID=137838 RepID=A0AA86MJB0_9CLOT|nr:Conserved hypothetical protein [Clostridium neonatale]CAH0438259.1 Conserved hypothetical protein [Clostridium neonatale]CAI3205108.1 Conserved hypothetical protein [Clostridium neonatale]CAI3207525.1 Conserved hypothetical protein [Clostridium neonatale]CAI3208326.1 Conserved hypothetical protein [Clostridium neonatale]
MKVIIIELYIIKKMIITSLNFKEKSEKNYFLLKRCLIYIMSYYIINTIINYELSKGVQ